MRSVERIGPYVGPGIAVLVIQALGFLIVVVPTVPLLVVVGGCLVIFPGLWVVLFVTGGAHNSPVWALAVCAIATTVLYTFWLRRVVDRFRR